MKEDDITAHTCSKCSTIYCEYSPGLIKEITDSIYNLHESIIDVAKFLVRRIEQKYTEDDMIYFADHMSIQENTNHGSNKDDLKRWEKRK